MNSETSETPWNNCEESLPNERVMVETKIDDALGCRNVQMLCRRGRLWFVDTQLSCYVYYTPTHWR